MGTLLRGGRPALRLPARTPCPRAEERQQIGRFFVWTAWAAVVNRPGEDYTYTNNWPPDRWSATSPTAETYLWSLGGILSLFLVLGLFIFFVHSLRALVRPGEGGAARREADRLAAHREPVQGRQVLPGGDPAVPGADLVRRAAGALHRASRHVLRLRRSPTSSRTVGPRAGTCSSPSSGSPPPGSPRRSTWRRSSAGASRSGRACWSSSCSAPSCWSPSAAWSGEVAGIKGKLGRVVVLARPPGVGVPGARAPLADPALRRADRLAGHRLPGGAGISCAAGDAERLPLPDRLLRALGAILVVVFFGFGLFYGRGTHLTVADYWRWFVVHIWVESIFEFFGVAVIALVMVAMGLVSAKAALRVAYFTAAIVFLSRHPRHRPPLLLVRRSALLAGDRLGVLLPGADPAVRPGGARHDGVPVDAQGGQGVPVPLAAVLPGRVLVLELPRRRGLRLPDQPADRQLLRARHLPDHEPRPRGALRDLRHALDRAAALLLAGPGQARGTGTTGSSRSRSGASTSGCS